MFSELLQSSLDLYNNFASAFTEYFQHFWSVKYSSLFIRDFHSQRYLKLYDVSKISTKLLEFPRCSLEILFNFKIQIPELTQIHRKLGIFFKSLQFFYKVRRKSSKFTAILKKIVNPELLRSKQSFSKVRWLSSKFSDLWTTKLPDSPQRSLNFIDFYIGSPNYILRNSLQEIYVCLR